MFAIQRQFVVAIVAGAIVVFACTSEGPDEEPGPGSAGAAGDPQAAGAGRDNSAGGVDPAPGGGGHESGEPEDVAGENSGGSASGAGPGSALGGASNGEVDRGDFTLVAPSVACGGGDEPQPAPITPSPGLMQVPASGQTCGATYEPNDAVGDACQLTLGAEIRTQLSAPQDKVDHFVFHAEAGVSYTLVISALDCVGSPGGDMLLVTSTSLAPTGATEQLKDKKTYFGTREAYAIKSEVTADELIEITTAQTCQYRVEVVQPTAQGLDHDAFHEPNDTPATAARVAVGARVQSSLVSPSDKTDYFTFPAQANVTYTVRASAEGCSGTPASPYVTLQGWSLGSGAAVENLKATQAYFGKVINQELVATTSGEQLLGFTTSQSCQYEFYVVPSTICGLAQGAEHEPNNTPSTAAAISLDETISAEIRPPTDETDFYSFPVEPKTKYTLTFSAANCKGSSSLSALSAELLNAKTNFPFGKEVTFRFTTGSAPQELLRIEGESCGYEFRVSKD